MREEVINKLRMSHQDELANKQKYCELAQMAENVGWCETAGVLRDIAHEEETHAKLIGEILNWDSAKG